MRTSPAGRIATPILAMALAACTSSPMSAPTETSAGSGLGTVDSVIDGDTVEIVVAGAKQEMQLIGLDAPRVREGLECFGLEAAAALASRLPRGTPITFTRDTELVDGEGRPLVYIYDNNGAFINRELVEDGYVKVARDSNVRARSELLKAESEAAGAGRGLWGTCPKEDSPER
jgi:micrococcal nuclease